MFDIEKIFSYDRHVTIGVELEGYLVVYNEDEDAFYVNEDEELLDNILNELDYLVYRDYYAYQIEIRTEPSDDPKKVADQLIKLISKVGKVCRQYNSNFLPISKFGRKQYCGMHVHVSSNELKTYESMISFIYSVYPIVLTLYPLTASSPGREGDFVYRKQLIGERLIYSTHIALLSLHKPMSYYIEEFIYENNRYYDIIINRNRRDRRHRIKDVDTVEIRFFDSVGSAEYIRWLITLIFEIASKINVEYALNEIVKLITAVSYKISEILKNYRYTLSTNVKTVNPITLIDLSEIVDYFCLNTRIEFEYGDTWITPLPFDKRRHQLDYQEVSKIIFPIR